MLKNCPKLETSPFISILLEISINWYTNSQGPKKIYPFFEREDLPTLLVIRVVLLHTLFGVLNPFFPNCIWKIEFYVIK